MSVETLNNSNEDLIQERLKELKEQIKPWIVKFENESKDKKYNIYSYTLVQWWTKWWIKNKYIKQIWPRIEWTQFTDKNWNEIKKDKFDAWERVFLRVPKKKETINQKEKKNTPWKVEYIWNKKDKQNRNWKFYSYTFTQWGNIWWAMNKFDSQLWKDTRYERYCDINWNKLKKEWFNKWETIYYKEPNTDIIDPTPEMNLNEIMKMSDNDISQFLIDGSYEKLHKNTHSDEKGTYKIINWKKLYITTHIIEYNILWLNDNTSYIDLDITWDGDTSPESICICRKIWNKLSWIYYDWAKDWKWKPVVYRWDIIQGTTKDRSYGAGHKIWTKSFSSYRNNIHNY